MTLGARSQRGRSVAALVAAALLAALFVVVPAAAPAAGGEVSKKGTLGDGYALVATDGGIFNYGDSEFFGSTGNLPLNKPIVGMEYTPTGEGYWLVASDGGIFTFGDAEFFGSTGAMKLNQPIVGMAATPTGNGYWLVAADGGIFTFGDAKFYGSTGSLKLVRPIVGIAVHPSGEGYWLVAADGGIFTFGDPKTIQFWGSQGGKPLNQPIVDMAPTETGNGYWMVATDGGIFTFGDAKFHGSQGARRLNAPIVGMTPTVSGQGYYMVASDGGIFTHGDAVFLGSRGGAPLNKPIVGMSLTPFSPVTAPDFAVGLQGVQEVPGPGDPDGSGFALIDITDDEICWYIQVDKIGAATAAHIHRGNAGVAGPVVFTFTTPDAEGVSIDCKPLDKTLSAEMMAYPQGFYVNVHNAEFPQGALRGQLDGHFGVAVTATSGTTANVIVFNTIDPSSATVLRTIDTQGAPIVGADFRPGTTDAYLLLVSKADGSEVTLVKSTAAGVTTTIKAGIPVTPASAYGFDFNPTVDRIRVVTNAGENFVLHPDTGEKTSQTNLQYAPGDPALSHPAGTATPVGGAAYTNNRAGATSTELFDIDYIRNTLVKQDPPAAGTLTTVGALGVDISANFGFDIAPSPAGVPGTAVVVGQLATGGPVVLAIDLATGKATNFGALGSDATAQVVAFAILV